MLQQRLAPSRPDARHCVQLRGDGTSAALLAMEGKFEDYTLGRNIEIERVKEVYRLWKKHGLELARLRSFGVYVTDEMIAEKRRLAEERRRQLGLPAEKVLDQSS